MGLDAVEIVMKVEETFNIAIADDEAEEIFTPRALINLVISKVGRTDCTVCLTQRAFNRFRGSMMKEAGYKREQIRPDVFMANLFPTQNRKELLARVTHGIGLTTMPRLVRPRWFLNLLFGTAIGIGTAVALFLSHLSPAQDLPNKLSLIVFSGIFTAILATWFLTLASRNFGNDFAPAIATVGDFARWIAANGPEVVNTPPGQWSREQVAIKVREIVVEVLGCEEEYREDAHFIKDLGLS